MIYILDTHYLLWSLFEPEKISPAIQTILNNSIDTKLISGVSLWEISLKYALGKLTLGGLNPHQLHAKIEEAQYTISPLENELLVSYYQLPKVKNHRDPFDRLLIWQALSNEYTILTQDQKFAQYRPFGLQIELG